MADPVLEGKLEQAQQLIDDCLADFDEKKYVTADEKLNKAYNLLDEVQSQLEGEKESELGGIASYLESDSAGDTEQWEEAGGKEDADEDAKEALQQMRASIVSAKEGLEAFELPEEGE